MWIQRTGTNSITDDDEHYLDERGRFDYNVDSNRIHHLLVSAIRECPNFYDTELFKDLLAVHDRTENVGFHCNTEYRSNRKRCICTECGRIVELT